MNSLSAMTSAKFSVEVVAALEFPEADGVYEGGSKKSMATWGTEKIGERDEIENFSDVFVTHDLQDCSLDSNLDLPSFIKVYGDPISEKHSDDDLLFNSLQDDNTG